MSIQISNPTAGFTDECRTQFVCWDHREQRSKECVYVVTDKNKPAYECPFCKGAAQTTHYTQCWKEHDDCALALVNKIADEVGFRRMNGEEPRNVLQLVLGLLEA